MRRYSLLVTSRHFRKGQFEFHKGDTALQDKYISYIYTCLFLIALSCRTTDEAWWKWEKFFPRSNTSTVISFVLGVVSVLPSFLWNGQLYPWNFLIIYIFVYQTCFLGNTYNIWFYDLNVFHDIFQQYVYISKDEEE